MTQKGFITVALPIDLVEEIDKIIKASDGLYVSRPHVIKLAINKYFKEEK